MIPSNACKKEKRLKRAARARFKIKRLGVEAGVSRLVLHRSLNHIYAQILAPVGGAVLAHASTLELKKTPEWEKMTKTEAAHKVGALLAERAKKAGVQAVACDRAGFKFHGRVKALVESARAQGLEV